MYATPPPPNRPPVSAAETADATALRRTYQVWKGSNIFFLQGRLIFGPDVRSLFLTIFLIVAPVAIFCVFVARKLIDDFAHHLGIAIMAVVIVLTSFDLILLLITSGRDPGIVPRNAHPPEPDGLEGNSEVGAGRTPPMRLPRTKDVVVNGTVVKIKYCDTCMLYRPPRCSHCSICNNCVEKFDHHCPWVGQCIGLRNYRFFFTFVFCSTLLCLYVHGFCWVYVRRIMDGEEISIWKALIKTPASIALILYSFIAVWFVGGLTVFHSYLISKNQSTYENFRYRYERHMNPYNKGVIGNFKEVFCTSIPPSRNNFRAKVPREPAIPPRTVDGGISPNMRKAISDIEMGRKPVWDGAADEVVHHEEQLNHDDQGVGNGGLADVSLGLSRDSAEGQNALYPRHSSWGRKSGRWEISPEVHNLRVGVAESKRIARGNSVTETEES